MIIRRALKSDIDAINEIITQAKSVWDYHPDYLQEAIQLIKIDCSWINEHEGYVLEDETICAFIGIKISVDSFYLEHLWVTPSKIGQGVGTQAMKFILSEAKKRRIGSVSLLPDPPAEGFYSRLGAVFTGKEVPSRIKNGPIFREMMFTV